MIHSVMQKTDVDYLKIYRGGDIQIEKNLRIHVPTLNEICEYGDREYYSLIGNICATPNDLCFQLYDIGIDFTKISDHELFFSILHKNFSRENTSLVFGNKIDFSSMVLNEDTENGEIVLIQTHYEIHNKFLDFFYKHFHMGTLKKKFKDPVVITKSVYAEITDWLRAIHGMKKDTAIPGNEATKMAMIDDARDDYYARSMDPYVSNLLQMVSTMVNMPGFKRDDKTVFDMNLYAFMDSIKRIMKIKNADILLQSGYSGFGIDLKKIKKEELDYMGELK